MRKKRSSPTLGLRWRREEEKGGKRKEERGKRKRGKRKEEKEKEKEEIREKPLNPRYLCSKKAKPSLLGWEVEIRRKGEFEKLRS